MRSADAGQLPTAVGVVWRPRGGGGGGVPRLLRFCWRVYKAVPGDSVCVCVCPHGYFHIASSMASLHLVGSRHYQSRAYFGAGIGRMRGASAMS